MLKNFLRFLFVNKNNIQENKQLTDFLTKNETFIKNSKFIDSKLNRLKNIFESELNGELEKKEENKRIEYKNKSKNGKI
jgi:hypothetical protein